MAEFLSATSAKFLQVAGAHKSSQKDPASDGLELGAFFGVLKAQLAMPEAGMELESKLHLKLGGLKTTLPLDPSADTDSDARFKPAPDSVAAVASAEVSSGELVAGVEVAPSNAGHLPVSAAVDPKTDADVAEKASLGVVVAGIPFVASSGQTDANPISVLRKTSAVPPDAAAVAGSADVAPKLDKDAAVLGKDAQAASTLAFQNGMSDVKPMQTSRSDNLIKAAKSVKDAANAADARQALPVTGGAAKTEALLTGVDASQVTKPDSTVSPALLPLTGLRAEVIAVGANSVNTSTQAFESVMRTAESKINVAIDTPVRSTSFAADFASKVVWMAGRQGQFAEMSLNPQQMGALEVRLTVSGGDATAHFFSPNAVVREAIDAALPKLRELMAQAGLNLGEAEVRDHAFSRQDRSETRNLANRQERDPVVGATALAGMVRSAGSGLVDLYI